MNYYDAIEDQFRVSELDNKIKSGFYVNPPTDDVNEIKAFYKEEYKAYEDLISKTDYVKPHIQGRDVGGNVDESVLEEFQEIVDKAREKVIEAKIEHMTEIKNGVTKDSVYYDKEFKIGDYDVNHVSNERDVEIITEINEAVKNYSKEKFGEPVVDLNIYSEDISKSIRNDQSEPSIFSASIVFNSKKLKEAGVEPEEVIQSLREVVEERQLPVALSEEFSKIPDHRMVVDGKSLVFTESEWQDVPLKNKKEFKEAIGAPTADKVSRSALSMKL